MSIDYAISRNSIFEIVDCEVNAVYSLDSQLDQLVDLLSIFSIDHLSLFPNRYRGMFDALGISADSCHFLPRYIFRDHVSQVTSAIKSIVEMPENRDYIKDYLTIKSFLGTLRSPALDKDKLISLSKKQKHDGPKNSILKFFTKTPRCIPRTVYSNSSTATGRLTVTDGPNILTAPAAVRNCFKSTFGGRILQIDIVAAEPKFAIHVKGSSAENIPADIYSDISTTVFSGKLSRAQIKIATLCALYGQSSSKLASQLPHGVSATKVISNIKDYFGTKDLLQNLRSNFVSGDMRNYIGRPLNPSDSGLLVSYFLQSSVAEASILMFDNFCKSNPGIKPCYIIHDALIVDASSEFCSKLVDGDSIDLFFNDWKFESKVTFLDNI